MTDPTARRAAEEALARYDALCEPCPPGCNCMRCHVRALLDEQGATPGPSCSTCDGYGCTTVPVHDRNGYPIPEQRKCDDCDGTGRAPAPPPASDEAQWLRVYPHCAGPADAITIEDVVTGKSYDAVWGVPPAEDEVREAAEGAAEDLGNVIYNIETGARREAEEQAREVRDALLAALSRPATPVRDEVREEAIYVASKTAHAPMWRRRRAGGAPIISTWIDEAGEGETASYSDLARRCISEITRASRVVLYSEPGEILKGALVEVGAALALGKTVMSVGGSTSLSRVFCEHPLWERAESLDAALSSPAAKGGAK